MIRLFSALVVASVLCGCQSGDAGSGKRETRELVVFGAASLTDAFNAVEKDFERQEGNVDVIFNFAGSQSLRTQIENGAQPQIFASANEKHMLGLSQASLIDEAVPFVENTLVVVVPADNPAGIRSFADLPKAQRLVLAGTNVPAGAYAEQVLSNASRSDDYGSDFAERVHKSIVSRETHVRQTLQKVVLGEADAAIVYATDAASVGDKVEVFEIPDHLNVVATYPIATVKGAKHQRLSQAFVDFVRSDAAAARFKEFGFRPVVAGQ